MTCEYVPGDRVRIILDRLRTGHIGDVGHITSVDLDDILPYRVRLDNYTAVDALCFSAEELAPEESHS
jgi:hypothetical protein